MNPTYTPTSDTTWKVTDGDTEIGTITKTATGYLCKGRYFQTELSNWEYAKTVFIPTELDKPTPIKDNQPQLWT
jgi:hypothetical protein